MAELPKWVEDEVNTIRIGKQLVRCVAATIAIALALIALQAPWSGVVILSGVFLRCLISGLGGWSVAVIGQVLVLVATLVVCGVIPNPRVLGSAIERYVTTPEPSLLPGPLADRRDKKPSVCPSNADHVRALIKPIPL